MLDFERRTRDPEVPTSRRNPAYPALNGRASTLPVRSRWGSERKAYVG
jgi:hypothetical protein